jgi:TPR repeat protein
MDLGVQYVNGDGVPQDMTQAYTWTAIAARRSKDPEVKARAEANLAQMAAHMPPQQVRAGEHAAAVFEPRTPGAPAHS